MVIKAHVTHMSTQHQVKSLTKLSFTWIRGCRAPLQGKRVSYVAFNPSSNYMWDIHCWHKITFQFQVWWTLQQYSSFSFNCTSLALNTLLLTKNIFQCLIPVKTVIVQIFSHSNNSNPDLLRTYQDFNCWSQVIHREIRYCQISRLLRTEGCSNRQQLWYPNGMGKDY